MLHDLRRWIEVAVKNTPVEPPPHHAHALAQFVLYTDASKDGWGAVLIQLATGRVFIAGSAWPLNYEYEVNRAEVDAIANAVSAFSEHLPKGSMVDLRVDNTSAEAGNNKAQSQSQGVSRALLKLINNKGRLGITLRATHVDTKCNFSDPVSRGMTVAWRKGE